MSPLRLLCAGPIACILVGNLAGCATQDNVHAVAPGARPALVYVVPPAAPPVREQAPTMPFEAFLPEQEDGPQRQWLWKVFQASERQAWLFAASPSAWVPLVRVDYAAFKGARAADWNSHGVIQVRAGDDPGVLFHETFHTVFHRSPFHAGRDIQWTEAFCDAFRFAAEREILPPPPSSWVEKIAKLSSMTYDEAGHAHHNAKWLAVYGYPASLVVRRSGGTLAGLRSLWYSLIELRRQRGGDVFDEFFGYSPADAAAAVSTPTGPASDPSVPLHTM